MKAPETMPRRGFLQRSVTVLGWVALGSGAGVGNAATPISQWPLALDMLEFAQFQPHVGTRFRARLEDGTVMELELTEAQALNDRARRPRGLSRAPFSLVFRGPAGAPRPQRIYALEHPSLGGLSIFLVPLGPDDQGQLYEAVFN
jgi:hypothetical protein